MPKNRGKNIEEKKFRKLLHLEFTVNSLELTEIKKSTEMQFLDDNFQNPIIL